MEKKTAWALYTHKQRIGYKIVSSGHKTPIVRHEWELIDDSVDYQQASNFMQEANRQGNFTPDQLKEMWYTQKKENAN